MTAWRPVPAPPIGSHQGRKHYVDGRPVTIISEDDDGYDYKFDDDPRTELKHLERLIRLLTIQKQILEEDETAEPSAIPDELQPFVWWLQ